MVTELIAPVVASMVHVAVAPEPPPPVIVKAGAVA